ncbi:MAG: HD domain-containing protein, partial [Oscillospiraceae bacterium]|nr:HD domain-containing protein [Oscillospiraceae bacterium]
WSSIYFISVSHMLLMLMFYIAYFAPLQDRSIYKTVGIVFCTLVGVDSLILLLNPFTGYSVTFTYQESRIAPWRYDLHPLYYFHLALCYLMILTVIFFLFVKIFQTPRIYRTHYTNIIVSTLAIVAMNAVFLFLPSSGLFDFSLLFYSLMAMLLYWNAYVYPKVFMPVSLRRTMFEQVDLPVVLFDYEDHLADSNSSAAQLFPPELLDHGTSLQRFISEMKLDLSLLNSNGNFSSLWNAPDGRVFRCDYCNLADRHGEQIGNVFVFSENSPEFDLLTGFHSKRAFRARFAEPAAMPVPVSASLFDLNRLAEMNDCCGRPQGDLAIRFLADSIRSHCPEGSYFARLSDANLLCICPSTSLADMRNIASQIRRDILAADFSGFPLDIQYACACTATQGNTVPELEAEVVQSLRTKKMLDRSSAHTSLLDSLAQVQQENDSDTEQHVQRTQILCNQLGLRLGLSDKELSDLSLLALMHDIGKLGIPVEVLNKPGRLTQEEWALMKTHAERGYRIAMASKELQGIAEMILHHHESWDGSGYPGKLKGNEIPLLSRVIAVVDAYDAMTNDRSYRSAMPVSSACAELKRCSGTQFDTAIVDEFTAMLGESEAGKETPVPKYVSHGTPGQPTETGTDFVETVSSLNYTHYLLDSNDNILQIDGNFEALTGYSSEDVQSRNLTQQDLIVNEDLPAYKEVVQNALSQNHEAFLEHRLQHKDGSLSYVICYGRQFYDPVSRSMRSEVVASDVENLISSAAQSIQPLQEAHDFSEK